MCGTLLFARQSDLRHDAGNPTGSEILLYQHYQGSFCQYYEAQQRHKGAADPAGAPALYQMCVEDNGTGVVYDPGNAGIGILNMKDRVKALGGTLQISTRKGFRIFITIPK